AAASALAFAGAGSPGRALLAGALQLGRLAGREKIRAGARLHRDQPGHARACHRNQPGKVQGPVRRLVRKTYWQTENAGQLLCCLTIATLPRRFALLMVPTLPAPCWTAPAARCGRRRSRPCRCRWWPG